MDYVDPRQLDRLAAPKCDTEQVILLGCQAWPPRPNGREPCPVCGGGPTDSARICGWCLSVSLPRQGTLDAALLVEAKKVIDKPQPIKSKGQRPKQPWRVGDLVRYHGGPVCQVMRVVWVEAIGSDPKSGEPIGAEPPQWQVYAVDIESQADRCGEGTDFKPIEPP